MSKKNNNVDDVRNWGMESTPSTTKKKTTISSSSKVVPLNNNQKKQRSPHLREAFNMIDKDNSGYIDAEELSLLLKLQGINATKEDVKNIIKMYNSTSTSGDELSFEEFCTVMEDSESGSIEDIAKSFAFKAKFSLGRMANSGEPMWMKQQRRELHMGTSDGNVALRTKKGMSARMELGKFVDGPYVQAVILVLIIIDVLCVICELTLAATFCLDPNAASSSSSGGGSGGGNRRRFLLSSSSTSPSPSADTSSIEPLPYDYTFCTDCMQVQIDVEFVLHWISVSILFVFAFQIFLLMVAYGIDFFRNPFFLLDALVVTVALILEIGFHVREGAIFAVLLSWRVVRIIHGFYSTVEIQHKETHKKIHHTIMSHASTTSQFVQRLKAKMAGNKQAILDLLKIQDALKANEATFHPENLQTMSKKELKEQLEKDLYMRLQIMQLVDVVKTDIEVIEEHVDEMEMELQKHKATHGHGH